MILSMMSLEGLGWEKGTKEVEGMGKVGMGKVGKSGGNSRIQMSRSMKRNKSLKEDSNEMKKNTKAKKVQAQFKLNQPILSITRV
jgi:hypothetical protein